MTGVWSTIDYGSTTPLCDDTHENGCVSKFTQMHSDCEMFNISEARYGQMSFYLLLTKSTLGRKYKKKNKQTLLVEIKTKRCQKNIFVFKKFYLFDCNVSFEGK